jgi:hypothetical protein
MDRSVWRSRGAPSGAALVVGAAVLACAHSFTITVLPDATPARLTVRFATHQHPTEPLTSLWYVWLADECSKTGRPTLWSIQRASRVYPPTNRPLDVTIGIQPDSSWHTITALTSPLGPGCYAIAAGTSDANVAVHIVVTADGHIEPQK